ncbi:type II toxin-antitoxin system RnlA family toxin [Ursidibacter sp. B-7004-1]
MSADDLGQYQDLNLDREQLESCLKQFCKSIQATSELIYDTATKKVYKVLKTGVEPARIVFHLKNVGTTTIQISEGKNKELNAEIAEYIKANLCQDGVTSLNMSISGINDDVIKIILDEVESIREKNNITVDHRNISGGILYQLKSVTFNDQLNISYYSKTNKLVIQGRPLSCYKVVAYALSLVMDVDTLAKILYKKDECDKIIVRPEVSEDLLKMKLPRSYNHLPQLIKNLLISSYCVKAASPTLPEYSMLTYCELRALEGIIKSNFLRYGIVEIPSNVGKLFDCTYSKVTIKNNVLLQNNQLEQVKASLEEAYAYYRQRRHSLFHMEGFVDSTSKVNSLQEALQICDKVYNLIENFY